MSDSSGFRSENANILALLAATLLLSACASNVYMGIPLAEGVGDPALRSLAQRASAGDKQAQLDLGIRYEEGRGVPADLARAESLYRLAASDDLRQKWIYTPPVGNGTSGRVIAVDRSAANPGLLEAQHRLQQLEKRRR